MSIDFRRTALLATSGLAVLLVAASASAQLPRLEQPVASPPGSGATDEETLLKQGVELREKGDDQGAMTVFGRAYALSKGARALAQLALAEQALGHWVDAETHLAGALSRGDDPWVTRNKTLLTCVNRTGIEVARLGQFGVNLDLDARRPARWPEEVRNNAAALIVDPDRA